MEALLNMIIRVEYGSKTLIYSLPTFLDLMSDGYQPGNATLYYQKFDLRDIYEVVHTVGDPFEIFEKGETDTLKNWIENVKEFFPGKTDLRIISDIIKAVHFKKVEAKPVS